MGHGSQSCTDDLRHLMEMQPDRITEGEQGPQPLWGFGRGDSQGRKRHSGRQRWARRVFGGTGTGTGSVPVPVPVLKFPFQCPLLPFQDPFFVRSSFRSWHLGNFFGTDLELTRSSFCYYRSSYRSCPFQLPFQFPFRVSVPGFRSSCGTGVGTGPL